MSADNNIIYQHQDADSSNVTPRELVLRYLPFLPWVLLCLAISLSIAFIKLRYSPNVYDVVGTLQVADPNAFSSGPDEIQNLLFENPNKNINDEAQVLRSRNIARRVAHALGLELRYYNRGSIRSTEISTEDSPFKFNIVSLRDSTSPFNISITIIDEQSFSLKENGPPIIFGQIFETADGRFLLTRTDYPISRLASREFDLSFAPAEERAIELVGGLSASPSGDSYNIMQLVYKTQNTRIGRNIVNQWMKEYQQVGLEEKKQAAFNVLQFIDEQLDTIEQNLGGVEKSLLGYRESFRVINPEKQSEQIFESKSQIEREIITQGVKIQIIDNLIRYISDNTSPYRQVASTLGIEEPSLALQIGEFNKLQVERETMLKTTTRTNPIVSNLETTIEKLRQDILENLKNIRVGAVLVQENLDARNNEMGREISRIPAKEKELLDITRRQQILQELYSFLLQKKLETSIGSASTISNVRVIEPAYSTEVPVLPNRRSYYIMAFFLGLFIPSLIIFLFEYLNDKVKSRADINRQTKAPILGEVGHSDESGPLVVTRSSRRFIAEQFRIIRTNLQYMLPGEEKAVILVTSSTSGEGKSFVSTNVGAVLALAGKKTAILEFDIRKPKIMITLGLAKKTGITNFMIGKASYEELPVAVPGYDNLFVIPCGPVPPNPSELLLNDKLQGLIERLRRDFEYIVIDTAPIGLVSDAMILGKFADTSLYIVRHNFTFKKQLDLLDEVYINNRLPKLSIVVNDIQAQGGYGAYYGYGGYGYTGYGYGYGNGNGSEYFDERKPKKGFLQRLLRVTRP